MHNNHHFHLTLLGHLASPNCAGRFAMQVLDNLNDGQVGNVIQTFRNTIYVRTTDEELICITSHDVKGPVNVNVETSIEFSAIAISDAVYKVDKMLHVRDLLFPLGNASVHEKAQQSNVSEGLDERVLEAANLLAILAVDGGLLDSGSPFFRDAAKSIRKIMWATKKGDFMALQSAVSGIVGLGNGSTPSGDDFLAGFLYWRHQIEKTVDHDIMNLKIENKTSWQSRKFIEYAQEGLVIEPLETFVNALFSGNEELITDAILDLSKIGHSSGLDAGLGVIIATAARMDDSVSGNVLKNFGL